MAKQKNKKRNLEYAGKNFSEKRRETTTKSTHVWCKPWPRKWEARAVTTSPPLVPTNNQDQRLSYVHTISTGHIHHGNIFKFK